MGSNTIACSRCQTSLPAPSHNSLEPAPCPGCEAPVIAVAFPALYWKAAPGKPGEPLVLETEASCYYHADKRVAATCDQCGRFLCSFCDLAIHAKHVCPACLESGKRTGKLPSIETRRVLYDSIALGLAVLPMLVVFPTILTPFFVLYVVIKYWNKPSSIIPRTRLRMILAVLLALLQIAGWAVLTGLLIREVV